MRLENIEKIATKLNVNCYEVENSMEEGIMTFDFNHPCGSINASISCKEVNELTKEKSNSVVLRDLESDKFYQIETI